ncbi:hypothetical protein COV16_05890 [Candidatus Woesearchaeota archaeon CG10_big_fil_rev_8_21_14_0_10_34_8]|nr:MAG: hypothetical protein COV16_05890 [Candidatus Woesearchaeota archaeon CG10_big_fil_rev_8_21_14_0_10_34_8]
MFRTFLVNYHFRVLITASFPNEKTIGGMKMIKEITKIIGLVGMLGIVDCANNVPESCKVIANDSRHFNEAYFPNKDLTYITSTCAERAYAHDKMCTVPSEFQALTRNQGHAASQYCLWLSLDAQ